MATANKTANKPAVIALTGDTVLKIVRKDNPKRAGTDAFLRYQLILDTAKGGKLKFSAYVQKYALLKAAEDTPPALKKALNGSTAKGEIQWCLNEKHGFLAVG